MCDIAGNVPIPPAELVKLIVIVDREEYGGLFGKADLTELRKACDDCPACMLAAIRLFEKREGDPELVSLEFNFKEEREKYWARINKHNHAGACYY